MRKPRTLSALVGVGLLGAVIGCGQSAAPAPPVVSPATAPVVRVDGKDVFEQHCAKCHALNGVGGGGGGWLLPPDLGKVGGSHSAEWLTEYVKDPKTLNAGAKMPPFGTKLTPEQVKAVGDYLAGLK